MTMRRIPELAGLFALTLGAASCEPSSITAAKQQLGRGPARTLALAVSLSRDTLEIGKFLSSHDTATTAGGLLGVTFPAESLASAIGQKLVYNNLAFQQFRFSYGQMLQAQPDSSTLSYTFAPHASAPAGVFPAGPTISQDTIRIVTPHGSRVAAATIASGSIIGRVTNGTACSIAITQSVNDSTGATVVSFPTDTVPPGGTVTSTVSAAGVSFKNYLYLGAPTVTPLPLGTCTPTPGQSVAVTLSTTALTLSSVTLQNVNEPFTLTDSILANETRIRSVDTVVVYSGSFTITAQNRLSIADTVHIQLNGVTKLGVPVTATLVLPAAPGNGTTTTGSTTIDLTNATIIPAKVVAVVTGVAAATSATLTSLVTTDAVVVDGGGSLVLQLLAGHLDPTKTPELTVPVEEFSEILKTQIDFGDLQDAIKSAHLNDAVAALTLRNTAQTPLTLTNMKLGVVKVNASGQLLRDGLGNPAYETDSITGLPILVTLAPVGQTTMLLPRASTTPLSLQMGPLVDRLVHLLLGNTRAAVVAAGSAVAGDGNPSRITRADSASVGFRLTVGLDLTLPDSGIVFTRVEWADGAKLKPSDSASVVNRLVSASASADVVNGTPFGMSVELAVVRDSVANTVDVFTLPGRTLLGPIVVAGSPVDGTGRVTTPVSSTSSLALTGTDVVPLMGQRFTIALRIRLRPPPNSSRGAVRTTDRIIVSAHANVELSGGGQ